jgi:hypothetical protein
MIFARRTRGVAPARRRSDCIPGTLLKDRCHDGWTPHQLAGATPRVRLRVGFILARRFTLCAFANFVDVLRSAATEAYPRPDPVSQISCYPHAIILSCGVTEA